MLKKVLTLDIGGSKIRIQTVDEDGNYGTETTVDITGFGLNSEKFSKLLTDNIGAFIEPDKDNAISAISIGVPGKVNSEDGVVEVMPNIEIVEKFPIADIVRKKSGLPVFLLNDADAGVLGEWWLGSGRGFKNLIYITLGTGVGGGVIINGELRPGLELGHTSLIIGDKQQLCSCTEINHAESYLGTEGLANIYTEVFGVNIKEMVKKDKHSVSVRMREGVMANDPDWLEVEEKYASYLSIFLNGITESHRPEVLILGGGIIHNNNSLFNKVKDKLASAKTGTNLVPAKFENSTNLGAAKYAFDHILISNKKEAQ